MSETTWIILISVLAFLVLSGIFMLMLISYIIFSVLLVRNKPEKWGHNCSQPDDPEIVTMFGEGLAWREKYADVRRSVQVESDGLTLYGEYFDFGFDRAVIIASGRMECCIYSCYFAEPYRLANYNVLVIDPRAHGFSEGKYNYVGFRECHDVLKWGELLHNEMGVKSIVMHGVCIGASTSLLALTDEKCPDYFKALTVEGMFINFYDSTRNHMIKDKRPLFPFLYLVMFYMRVILGVNAVGDGPLKRIHKLNKPILFLHGKKDLFSLPKDAEVLYEKCPSKKKLVWFDEGAHSRLRINNTEQYDTTLTSFLTTLEQKQTV